MAILSDDPRPPLRQTIRADAHALRPRAHGMRRVLVCLDRSRGSEICLLYAICMSKTFGSALTLVHVQEGRHERSGPHGPPRAIDAVGWELSRHEAVEYLEHVERRAVELTGQRVDVRLEQGHPGERIAALA